MELKLAQLTPSAEPELSNAEAAWSWGYRWNRAVLAGRWAPLPLLLGFIAVLTVHAILSRWTAPVWNDAAEAWAWGRQLQLGYYKHPPFYAAVARVWFDIVGRSDWSAYLLAALTTGVGLYGIWCLAGRILGPAARMPAVLLVMLMPHHTVMATNFNANIILLALWPWAAYMLVRTIESRSLMHATLFGALAAAALLSKYVSALFLVSCLLAAALHPDRGAIFRSPAPYVAGGVCLLLCSPHFWWLATSNGVTIDYALKHAAEPASLKSYKTATSLLALVLLLAPMLATLSWMLGRNATVLLARNLWRHMTSAEWRWLTALALGPLVLTTTLGLTGQVKVQTNYLIPMVFALPILLLAAARTMTEDGLAARLLAVVNGVAVLLLALSPAIAFGLGSNDINHAGEPTRKVARVASQLWHERIGTPIRLVAGTEVYSLGLTFHSTDRPAEFTHFNPQHAPWVDAARIAREGLLIACVPKDRTCIKNAEQYATAQTQRIARTFKTRFLGRRGPNRIVRYFLIPPSAEPPSKL